MSGSAGSNNVLPGSTGFVRVPAVAVCSTPRRTCRTLENPERTQENAAEPAEPHRTLFEVVLLGVVPEGPKAHTEQLGRLDLHAASAAQRLGDVLPLDVLDVTLEVEA